MNTHEMDNANNRMRGAVDIHSHVLFDIDDGSRGLEMSLAMLRRYEEQKVTDVFCTSHSWGNLESYRNNLEALRLRGQQEGIQVSLHSGCEIQCGKYELDDVVRDLRNQEYPSLGGSPFVLVEFSTHTDAGEIFQCLQTIQGSTDYQPVLAHAERYESLADPMAYQALVSGRIPVQINLYSLVEESRESRKVLARRLLKDGIVTFVGSDSHRSNHRPPNVESGLDYIYRTCDREYANAVCFRNAKENLLGLLRQD